MHILINALSAKTGGGLTYLNHLIRDLDRIDKKNSYTVLVTEKNQQRVLGDSQLRINIVTIGVGSVWRRLLYEQWGLPRLIDKIKADLIFAPAEIAPLRARCPVVLGIQNPNPYYNVGVNWSVAQRLRHFILRIIARPSARKAKRVIFVSDTSRRHVAGVLGIDPNKTRVIHHGVDLSIFDSVSSSQAQDARDRYCGGENYVLSVSDLMPHKNYPMLMEAYSLLSSDLRDRFRLLIVGGGKAAQMEALKKHAQLLGIPDRVVFSGSVPHQELAGIYGGATLFVMPSRLETFGIPLIEAMASGLPVVASKASAIPEVVGKAALLFDPDNVQKLASSMTSVLTDEQLRGSLIASSRTRAADFSLESTASNTLQVFEDALRST